MKETDGCDKLSLFASELIATSNMQPVELRQSPACFETSVVFLCGLYHAMQPIAT